MNFLDATVRDGRLSVPDLSDAPVTVAQDLPPEGTRLTLGLRPQHLELDLDGTSHSVEMTEALGGVNFLHLASPSGTRMIAENHARMPPASGARLAVRFDPAHAMLFDAQSGRRLR